MAWIILFFAGLLEVGWAYGLKLSDGFSKPWVTAATIALMIGSVALLALALRQLPLGTAYAIWTGIGAVGTAIVGIVVLREPTDLPRLMCIGLIACGIIGLKLFTKTH